MVGKVQIEAIFGYLNSVQKTSREIILAFPDDKLDWAPKPEMRTPREIVEHIYSQAVANPKAVVRGTLTEAEDKADHTAPKTGGVAELLAWVDGQFAESQRLVALLTEEQLASPVVAFFGEFSGGTFLTVYYDELWHHRGQLTVYLRLLDRSVPFIYNY